jgi:uncharacterized protein (DUF3084 family)
MKARHHTTVNCDALIIELAKKEGIKLSETFEEALRNKLYDIDPELYTFTNGWQQKLLERDIELKKMELAQMEKNLQTQQNKVASLETERINHLQEDERYIQEEINWMMDSMKMRYKTTKNYDNPLRDRERMRLLNERLQKRLTQKQFREKVIEPALKQVKT